MNNKTYEIAKEILTYLSVVRAVGNTTAVVNGAKNTENCIVLIHSKDMEKTINEIAGKKLDTASLGEVLHGHLRGTKKPIVIDNAALLILLSDLVSAIEVLRKDNAEKSDKIRIARAVLGS